MPTITMEELHVLEQPYEGFDERLDECLADWDIEQAWDQPSDVEAFVDEVCHAFADEMMCPLPKVMFYETFEEIGAEMNAPDGGDGVAAFARVADPDAPELHFIEALATELVVLHEVAHLLAWHGGHGSRWLGFFGELVEWRYGEDGAQAFTQAREQWAEDWSEGFKAIEEKFGITF